MAFGRKGREEERVGKGKREKKGEERGRKKREEAKRQVGDGGESRRRGKKRKESDEDRAKKTRRRRNDDDRSDWSGRRSIRCPVPAPSSALASPYARSEARIDRPLWLRRGIG